jgi:hypothetical protein
MNTAEKYFTLCTVHADTSTIAEALKPQRGQSGTYYRLDFEMILSFGLTELKAQIAWFENVSTSFLLWYPTSINRLHLGCRAKVKFHSFHADMWSKFTLRGPAELVY